MSQKEEEVKRLNASDPEQDQQELYGLHDTEVPKQAMTDDKGQPKSNKKKILIIVAIFLVIGVVLAIVLPLTLGRKNPPTPPDYPTDPFTYQEFNPYSVDVQSINSSVWYQRFNILQNSQRLSTTTKEISDIDPLYGENLRYKPINPTIIPNKKNNIWSKNVSVEVDLVDNYQARLIVQDVDQDFRVPDDVFPRPVNSHEARFTQVNWELSQNPFYFKMGNIYNKEIIISTEKRKMLVSQRYSEIGFVLPTQRLFGLGQSNGKLQLQNGSYSLWARGRQESLPLNDYYGGKNGNHIHPFILGQTANKDFFGIFFVSTSAQSFEIIHFDNYDNCVLNYITLGGAIEVYFIMRGKAQEIISKYHAMIGFSAMPPYYALGHFQGSKSYNSIDKMNQVFSGYKDLNIALEGIFIESYTQNSFQEFTLNQASFPGLPDYMSLIHGRNQHVIWAQSSAIAKNITYIWYNNALTRQCLLMSRNKVLSPLTTILSNTQVVYIDPFNTDSGEFYFDAISALNATIGGQIDGLLLTNSHQPSDINGELQNASSGKRLLYIVNEDSVGTYQPYSIDLSTNQDEYSTYYMPFIPGFSYSHYLDNQTTSGNATMGGGSDGKTFITGNWLIHNAVAHKTFQRVAGVLQDSSVFAQGMTRRSLLYNEASWAGSGAYGAGLITNMYRSWNSLKSVIAQAMGLSMYGINNVVMDVCGSHGPMDEELCTSWMQIGAFMPMVRNYYNESYLSTSSGKFVPTDPSEPYTFQNFSNKVKYSSAVSQKLSYSRYVYSQMYQNYREGGALVKPLFFDYPNDSYCFDNVEHTYMLGDALKVSPILEQGKVAGDQYPVYFPSGVWVDLNHLDQAIDSDGEYVLLNVSDVNTNIHLKAGKIIPYQKNANSYKTTRDFETKLRTQFIINRDSSQYAEGFILIDDGVSNFSYYSDQFTFWKVRYAAQSINFWVQYGNFNYEPEGYQAHYLDSIIIAQADDLNTTDFACFFGRNLQPIALEYDYSPYKKTLTLMPTADMPDVTFKDIGFIKFGDSSKEPNVCDNSAFSYKVTDFKSVNDTFWTYTIENKQVGTQLLPLVATFALIDNDGTINVQITTKDDYESNFSKKFHVPSEVYDLSKYPQDKVTKKLSDYVAVTSDPFSYNISTDGPSASLMWRSDPLRLYFDDYMVFDSGIFSMNAANNFPLLGMGERAGSLFYTDEDGAIHSRWTFDQANPIDDGLPPGKNMYGYQPMYAYQAQNSVWVAVLDLNTYATDYIVYTNKGVDSQIHKIVIGGTINKFFFTGSKPDEIVVKYQKLVGNPTMPPLWAFGWHQCRFGYVTDTQWYEVYQQYAAFDLPLDTMWADIDYMDDYKLFTISSNSYPNLAKYVEQVHKDGRTFVPIMDAGVAARENTNYTALDKGLEKEVFIKRADGSGPLTAGVWCGNAYFPDFFKPETVQWWKDSFEDLYTAQGLVFDGIWLDENEATNFCNGYCKPEERPKDSMRNKPYYVPGWRDLEDKALGVDGTHANGWKEYDVHNLFSLEQAKATAEYLISKKMRPYILTRANFPGIGKYAHHWLGDNWSTVDYMALSVDGIYSYQLFGLPFMGSDICGFNGSPTPELCTRWHQLGSLYPFSRNHNQNATPSHEPYVFNTTINSTTTVTWTSLIKTALINRYSLVKYYYASFWQINQYGGSFFKPLFYEFPSDPIAYQELQKNIMLGESLKASIETTTLVESEAVNFYFPTGLWCQIFPVVDSTSCFNSDGGASGVKPLRSHIDDYYIHLRGGYIIPFQDAFANKVRKTLDLRGIPTDLYLLQLTAPTTMTLPSGSTSQTAVAMGYIYFDDCVSVDQKIARFDLFLEKAGTGYNLKVIDLSSGRPDDKWSEETIGVIHILWANNPLTMMSNLTKAVLVYKDQSQKPLDSVKYDPSTNSLLVTVAVGGVHISFWDISMIQLTLN